MYLDDEAIEFAFSGTDFTNIGEDDNALFDFSNLTIIFRGIYKSEDVNGANSIVIRLDVSNRRRTEIWLCYSLLLNNAENYIDNYYLIQPEQKQEIDIWVEDYDVAYSHNRRARAHFVLEDGRRRILGRCNSICIDYNIFSGRYRYKKFDNFSKGQRRHYRELEIHINQLASRPFFSSNWSDMYIYKTIPVIITNCTDRHRSFKIETLEFDGKSPEEIIGLNSLADVISISEWGSYEFSIVISSNDYMLGEAKLYFNFTDIATNNRYINEYTYNEESQICKIDHSFVFIHDRYVPVDRQIGE